jgi:rod shape-determining protein MreC
MEFLLSRYRNLTVLLAVLLAQLLLLAYQVKSSADVPLIRVWAVAAVTPPARIIEGLRSGTVGFARDYIFLRDLREENQRLKQERDQLKLQKQFLESQLQTADRTRALVEFRSRTPSKTIGASVIMTGTGADSKVVFVDRGSASGIQRGMAVITADGIVGKVVNSYPMASQVLLATDPTFAASVVSQKNRVHGTLKGGIGRDTCIIDHIQNEDKVEVGEWFYTSGDDRVFPKGLPAGQVRSVHDGRILKDIVLSPAALEGGLESVLIVLDGVHQAIPDPATPPATETYILPAPPAENKPAPMAAPVDPTAGGAPQKPPTVSKANTEADRMLERYQKIGEAQNHVYGGVGSRVPDFNVATKPKPPASSSTPAATVQPPATAKPVPAPKSVEPPSQPVVPAPKQQ